MASVRQQYPRGGSSRIPFLEPGELVWARVMNGLENPSATGKARPVVLVEPNGYAWQTMGLTTNRSYRDGSPRVAIPNPGAVGLRGPGWLWGERLCQLSGLDIESHIGWVDEALAFEVAELARLAGPTVNALLTAARRHHTVPRLHVVDGGRS